MKIIIQSIIELTVPPIIEISIFLGEKQETKQTNIFLVLATIICNNHSKKAVLTDYCTN